MCILYHQFLTTNFVVSCQYVPSIPTVPWVRIAHGNRLQFRPAPFLFIFYYYLERIGKTGTRGHKIIRKAVIKSFIERKYRRRLRYAVENTKSPFHSGRLRTVGQNKTRARFCVKIEPLFIEPQIIEESALGSSGEVTPRVAL